jgi:hypothetical protein
MVCEVRVDIASVNLFFKWPGELYGLALNLLIRE